MIIIQLTGTSLFAYGHSRSRLIPGDNATPLRAKSSTELITGAHTRKEEFIPLQIRNLERSCHSAETLYSPPFLFDISPFSVFFYSIRRAFRIARNSNKTIITTRFYSIQKRHVLDSFFRLSYTVNPHSLLTFGYGRRRSKSRLYLESRNQVHGAEAK
jgi:hypothetical protein